MQNNFHLILNGEFFNIPSNFVRMNDISQNIYISLKKNAQYIIKSNISKEVMQSIINYLTQNELPNITAQNKIEYYQLSKEFNIMGNLLYLHQDTVESYLHNIDILKDQSINDKSQFEEIISNFLDDYLLNCGEELFYTPIQSLYRIFNNENRKLTNQNLCYNLIKQHFDKTKDSTIFSLLPLLDGENLSEENIRDSIESRNKRLGMMPNIEFSYFLQKDDEIKKLKEEIKRIENDKNEEVKKLLEIIQEFRFYLNYEYKSKYLKYKFFIPIGKQWNNINDRNHITLTDNDTTFTVICSSSLDDNYHCLKNLFTGKKEVEGNVRWASVQSPKSPQSITICFSVPVAANVLSMTSRERWKDQAPTNFRILASNDQKSFVLLKKYAGIDWDENEVKLFIFMNENSYSCYKIEFTASLSPNNYYGLADLNIGVIIE